MASTVIALEDVMIDGLSYSLPPGASYVVNRRSVSFHPTGSNKYSPNAGVKLIKMALASDDYLDPSTVKFGFELVSDDPDASKQLRPLGGPRMFFRRMRALCGGQIIEDVDYYNRTHEMFHDGHGLQERPRHRGLRRQGGQGRRRPHADQPPGHPGELQEIRLFTTPSRVSSTSPSSCPSASAP